MLKRLKRGFGATLALTAVLTGVGLTDPGFSTPAAQASSGVSGDIELSHSVVTEEAQDDADAGRLLTNATVRLSANVNFGSFRAADYAIEYILPPGLYADGVPGHCVSSESSLVGDSAEPSRTELITASTWEGFEGQVLTCSMTHSSGVTGNDVWIDARVRPEMPPGYQFEVGANLIHSDEVIAFTDYDELPPVHSEAEFSMGPHLDLHDNWPFSMTSWANAWAWTSSDASHGHPETELAGHWRLQYPIMLTVPSQYGNQPLDWANTDIVFDWEPEDIYYPGVTDTDAWRDRQRSHGDAYEYYMPNMNHSGQRPGSHVNLTNAAGRNANNSYRGGTGWSTHLDPDARTLSVDAAALDTTAWTVPSEHGDSRGTKHAHKADDYSGPEHELVWGRHLQIYIPAQAVRDLIGDAPSRSDGLMRLPVNVSNPRLEATGLFGDNKPWTAPDTSYTWSGLGSGNGYNANLHHTSAPWGSSPLNTNSTAFSPGYDGWWEGLPGSRGRADGNGQIMPGQTMMYNSTNRITAPVFGGATAQFQCVGLEDELSVADVGDRYHPVAGRGNQGYRFPDEGLSYFTGSHAPGDGTYEDNLKYQIQYSGTPVPNPGGRLSCNNANGPWYEDPADVPGNNRAKERDGIYTGVSQVRFVVATDVPERWSLSHVIPMVNTDPEYRGEAWVWTSYSSHNYNSLDYSSLGAVPDLDEYFNRSGTGFVRYPTDPRYELHVNRREPVEMVDALSMVNIDADTPVRGGDVAELRVTPHTPADTGPLTVTVNYNSDRMVYHDMTTGPEPVDVEESGANSTLTFVINRPDDVDELVIQMVTLPNDNQVFSTVSAHSRMPGEASRANNEDTVRISIESTNPISFSMTAEDSEVDVHPFTGEEQVNRWNVQAGNATPFLEADVRAYMLVPRDGMGRNAMAHDEAAATLRSFESSGWAVHGSTSTLNYNSFGSALEGISYGSLPNNLSSIEVVRFTGELSPNETFDLVTDIGFNATSHGDVITPAVIYEMDMHYEGAQLASFTGVVDAPVDVIGGQGAGLSWVDGTHVDHDGMIGDSPIGVPGVPVSVSGTTAAGLDITDSVHSVQTQTDSNGEWLMQHLPEGSYDIEFAGSSWFADSDFTAYTTLGGDSNVGYSGSWSSDLRDHQTQGSFSVPGLGADNRTGYADAGMLGESVVSVDRETSRSHDYGYRETDYKTVFTVSNSSDTFVEDVEVVDSISGPVSGATATVSGAGSVSTSGTTVTYTVSRLNPGDSATITVNRGMNSGAAEGDVMSSGTTSSQASFYGFDSATSEASNYTGEAAVPTLDADISWTDSGSWLPNIDDDRSGWQTGSSAPSDAAMVEPFDARNGAVADSETGDGIFGPGESLDATYTVTNESDVVSVSVTELLGQLTGVDIDEERSIGSAVLAPGESADFDAAFVDALAQVEVDMDEAVADLEASGVAPRFAGNYSTETQDLDDEITNPYLWGSWEVPFHRVAAMVLSGTASDGSGDHVVEDGERGLFDYTWVNIGNLTLRDPGLDDATGQSPRFEDGFDNVLSPGEQVRGRTDMTMQSSMFTDGVFLNVADGFATPPLEEDVFDVDNRGSVLQATTALSERSAYGLDLSISLHDEDGDGTVSLGESFGYNLVLRNNSAERYSDVDLVGDGDELLITVGDETYRVEARADADFDGTLASGEQVEFNTELMTATDDEASVGYIDIRHGQVQAQGIAEGTPSTGDAVRSNEAVDRSQVYAEPLIVAAGEGAGASMEEASSTNTLYWVLIGIAVLVMIGLMVLLVPRRRTEEASSKQDEKESASV